MTIRAAFSLAGAVGWVGGAGLTVAALGATVANAAGFPGWVASIPPPQGAGGANCTVVSSMQVADPKD